MVLATRIGCDHLLYALFSASSCSASNVRTGGLASRITRSLILRRRDRAQLLAILLFKRRTTEYSPLFASKTIPSAASLAVFTLFLNLVPLFFEPDGEFVEESFRLLDLFIPNLRVQRSRQLRDLNDMKYHDSCILQNSKDSESFDQAPTIEERGYRYQDFPLGRLVVNQFSLRHWLAFVLVSIQYH